MGSSESAPVQLESLTLKLRSPEDLEIDDEDSVYALRICGQRCKLSRCSNVYLIAVRSHSNTRFKPHCGILLENTFTVSVSGKTHTFSYALAHVRTESSKICIEVHFCGSVDAAFNQLKFLSAYQGGRTAKIGGWTSSIACSTAVKEAKSELDKRFDLLGHEAAKVSSSGNVELNSDVTNCALFAVRLYSVLAREEVKVEGKVMDAVKEMLGKLDLADQLGDYSRMLRSQVRN